MHKSKVNYLIDCMKIIRYRFKKRWNISKRELKKNYKSVHSIPIELVFRFFKEHNQLVILMVRFQGFIQKINFQNMKIGQFMNPLSSNWDTYESVSILNSTHVLYKNDRLKTNPALQSLTLPANTVKSILYNRDMRINTEETIRI